jgi:peptide deformylase
MTPRPYVKFPDKRLRATPALIEAVTDETRAIWDEMLAAMYSMPGVGLAANQLGIMQALAVVDCSDTHNEPVRMANPVILHSSVKIRTHEEGSPNLPGVWAKIDRPRAVTVQYMDELGVVVEKDFVGLWATSVQHQVDHLNGKMFFDHLSDVKRKMLVAKAAKLAKKRG